MSLIVISIGETELIKKTLILFSLSFLLVLWLGANFVQWPFFIAITYSLASGICFVIYAWDKRLAIKGHQTRVSERTLHLLALIGGWPGALLAQQLLRHKSKKRAFIAVLWLTIVVNCSLLASLYYLNWI